MYSFGKSVFVLFFEKRNRKIISLCLAGFFVNLLDIDLFMVTETKVLLFNVRI